MGVFIYQINMPCVVEDILDDPTFMWMLSPDLRYTERYKQLKCLILNGYQFDAVIFDFLVGQITIFMRDEDIEAVESLLCSFSICSRKTLSFPTVKNKKSFTL